MFRIAQRSTLHLWIALLAVLFSALAPSLSHALAPTSSYSSFSIGAICSSDGNNNAPDGGMAAMQHCAYCLSHANTPALLPAAPAHALRLEGHDVYPPLRTSTPHYLQYRDTAHARGPPRHS